MKCVFIINPHAGEADNEEKSAGRRRVSKEPTASSMSQKLSATRRNLCEIGAKNMPAKR